MKHAILTSYLNKEITAKEALVKIGGELARRDLTKKETNALMAASDAILDAEVPLSERDADAEEAYAARLRQGDE